MFPQTETTCSTAVVTVNSTDSFTFKGDGSANGASVGGNDSCTVSVSVTAALAGSYNNLSGALSTSAGSAGTASASLTVEIPPDWNSTWRFRRVPSV